MEGAGAAAAPPQALAPAAPPTRRGAGAAAPRGFELAADVFLCCFMGALLVCSATIATFMAARRACGRHSRAAAVTEELFVTAFQASVLLLQFIFLARTLLRLLVLLGGRNEAREARIIGAARGRQGALRGHVTAHVFFVSFMSMMVGILLGRLAPTEESYTARVGYMVGDTGCFLYSVAFCTVLYPELLVQLRSTYAKLKEV